MTKMMKKMMKDDGDEVDDNEEEHIHEQWCVPALQPHLSRRAPPVW
eukprot:CAMPEP_0175180584 /NCGR_PEP_ID=MMETSP0087-20121206/36155_1 /TAXON_ID=136419 /ORGANISM="Unknown Unknown, Strain D1" /LENGTH=45 /DNA_ID= /DNA_START= /DNA_END= /DNA_ORIENTATION=